MERRGGEVARRRQHEIIADVIGDGFFRRVFVRRLHPVVAVVDAPEIGRDALAEVAEDDLQGREFVEQARSDPPQRMYGGLRGQTPSQPQQSRWASVRAD